MQTLTFHSRIHCKFFRNFWDVLMSFTEEQKRKFLRFTTGSDRAPYVFFKQTLKSFDFVLLCLVSVD